MAITTVYLVKSNGAVDAVQQCSEPLKNNRGRHCFLEIKEIIIKYPSKSIPKKC
jgi:hypothetical protein